MVDFAQIRALLRLQQRTVVNAFRENRRRRGAVVSIALSVAWYGIWLAAAFICALTPRAIGRADVEEALPGILLFILGYWQLSPIVTLSLGVSLDMRKLAYYPARTPTLFVVECLLRLYSAWETVLVLTGVFIGLAWAGSPHLAPLLLGLILFVAFNIFFSAGTRNLIERIFQKRWLRELSLTLMVTLTVLPQMLAYSERARSLARLAVANRIDLPYWLTPSGLAARLAVGLATFADVLLLVAMVAVAGAFGYVMFAASVRLTSASTAGEQAPATRRGGLLSLLHRVVSAPVHALRDPIGALVDKEVRYLWRSPRFRLPFFMGFTFAVIVWVPIMNRVEGPLGQGMRESAPALVALYTFLLLGPVLFLNRFGFDRGSVRFYFWMPITFGQLLAAKNLATLYYCVAEALLITAVCAAVGLPVGPWTAVEAVATTCVALLYLLAVGNHMSVVFPIPSNPDRVSRSGGGHGVRAAAQFLLFPLSLSPVLVSYFARYVWADDRLFLLLMTASACAGAVIYLSAFWYASRRGVRAREELVTGLSAGEGPVAAE